MFILMLRQLFDYVDKKICRNDREYKHMFSRVERMKVFLLVVKRWKAIRVARANGNKIYVLVAKRFPNIAHYRADVSKMTKIDPWIPKKA